MQSIFRLPWCTDQQFGPADNVAFGPVAMTPALDVAAYKKLKRKRAATPDSQEIVPADVKRQRLAAAIASDISTTVPATRLPASAPPVVNHQVSMTSFDQRSVIPPVTTTKVKKENKLPEPLKGTRQEEDMAATQDTAMLDASTVGQDRTARLRQAIENQLNLQILLKHNELRLIDQELAKCQIALEQLRRCELQTYPGSKDFDYAVSSGTGPAVMPPPGYTKPSHAAPHGVVDGPYSRHYRQWLLPGAQFEPQSYASITPADDAHIAGRSTRHAGSRKSVAASVATPSRYADHLQHLPAFSAPAPKRDSSSPLLLRRSTDNKLVKLVCNNCNRGNMSSIQGFLNHCRIAHKVVYESHDAAAIDCGRILDDEEIANLPAEAQAMPVSKPVVKHTPSRAVVVAAPVSTTQSVHPLNRSDSAALPPSKSNNLAKPVISTAREQPAQFAATPFKPAAGLSKLSALMARRNCGGDLQQAVVDARRRPDFTIDDVLSPASLTPGSPADVTPSSGRGMLSAPGNGRATAGKSHSQAQRPQHSYFAPAQPRSRVDLHSPCDSNMSPHTVDSNPGLVSDVEDDDNGSASEEESHAPHGPIAHFGVRRDCTDNMDIDVAVEDGLDQHGVVIRRNSMIGPEDRSVHNGSGPSRKFTSN